MKFIDIKSQGRRSTIVSFITIIVFKIINRLVYNKCLGCIVERKIVFNNTIMNVIINKFSILIHSKTLKTPNHPTIVYDFEYRNLNHVIRLLRNFIIIIH